MKYYGIKNRKSQIASRFGRQLDTKIKKIAGYLTTA